MFLSASKSVSTIVGVRLAAAGLLLLCSQGTLLAEEAPPALSKPEAALQGTWKTTSGWLLEFDGHTFSAKSGNSWYVGSFNAPVTDEETAPLDLKIEDCECNYKGMTSKSIYRFKDEGLLMSGATPGKSRPPIFDGTMGLVLDLNRVAEAPTP